VARRALPLTAHVPARTVPWARMGKGGRKGGLSTGSDWRRGRRGRALRHRTLGQHSLGLVLSLGNPRGQPDGGYTTFSAFSFETVTLLHASQWQSAALYVAGSVIFSLLACGLGFALGQGIIR
jgi:hypothetical protein